MQPTSIEHQGIVKRVIGNSVEVEIQIASACAHCSATDQCVSADSKSRIITVENYKGETLKEEQIVTISEEKSSGLMAVLWAYFIPFILIVCTLFIANIFVRSEGVAGLLSLSILIPYYTALYFAKSKLKQKFSFKINI